MAVRGATSEQKRERVERLAKVARLRLAGERNQSHIADMLGYDRSTISKDFKTLDEQWQKQAAADVATEKGIQNDRLEAIIAALWVKAMEGDTWTVDRVLAALSQKADLYGLNAPAKQEIDHTVTHYELDGISNDELSGVITPAGDA